eukprot:SAG31_NODE_19398_length_603_cov_1.281746_2_plen_23_part_01
MEEADALDIIQRPLVKCSYKAVA